MKCGHVRIGMDGNKPMDSVIPDTLLIFAPSEIEKDWLVVGDIKLQRRFFKYCPMCGRRFRSYKVRVPGKE